MNRWLKVVLRWLPLLVVGVVVITLVCTAFNLPWFVSFAAGAVWGHLSMTFVVGRVLHG